jgi:hypothetical protein
MQREYSRRFCFWTKSSVTRLMRIGYLVIVALLANNGEYSGECKLELSHVKAEGPPSEVHHSVIEAGPRRT